MRVLLAFDKFKDSLTARDAAQLAARALRGRHGDWQLDLCPLTDGGEGFAEILTRAAGGQMTGIPVAGPRGGLVQAKFGMVSWNRVPAAARVRLQIGGHDSTMGRRSIAVIEMAAASGLALLPPGQRDPWHTTSLGTGQLVRAAAELGATAIVLGVGGSATNDLGLGALTALGFEFRAADGKKIHPPTPATWERVADIEGALFPSVPPIRIACDVTNPLLGPHGATAIYGPQKGLPAGDHDRLEAAMARLARRLCHHCAQPESLRDAPGTGAAGGIAFGLLCAARARLLPGFDLTAAWLDLEARLAAADLVVTGEGRFDESSLSGKGPGGIAARALALGKPVHVFAGHVGPGAARAAEGRSGLQLHAISPDDLPLAQALREAPERLVAAVQGAL